MKRLHKKTLTELPDHVLLNSFQTVTLRTGIDVQVYLSADPFAFGLSLIMLKLQYISLPFIDAYEVRVGSDKGIVIGYVFDVYGKSVSAAPNFVIACNHEFRGSGTSELNGKLFDMKYKLKDVFLYEYEGMAAMLTCGLPESVKESLELN